MQLIAPGKDIPSKGIGTFFFVGGTLLAFVALSLSLLFDFRRHRAVASRAP
ncbi:MAG: hypothetical protein NVS3B7_08340 [Candidatus Elarobacter sp.]